MGVSCGWTDFMFISRRSVFEDLQQRRPKCIFEHDKRRFMASLPSSSLDACPRPLPRAVYPQMSAIATTTLVFSVALCICHFLLTSSTAHHAVRRHEDHVSLES